MLFPEMQQLKNIHYQSDIAITIIIMLGIILVILLNRILIQILKSNQKPRHINKLKYTFVGFFSLFLITVGYNFYLTKQLYQPQLHIKSIIDTYYGTNLLVTENTKFLTHPYISYKENKTYRIFDDQRNKIDIYHLKIKDYHIYIYDNHQKSIQPK